MKFKLNVVNKKEYEEKDNYKEIIIVLPKDSEELEKDFEYLGLDYKFLSVQDTHVKKVEILNFSNKRLSNALNEFLENVKEESDRNGYTMPFNNVKHLYDTIKDFNESQMVKLLAVLEAERGSIENINDLVDFSNRLDEYVLDDEIFDAEAYARSLFDNGDLVVEDVTDYINIDDIIDCIDLDAIGRDHALDHDRTITTYGVVECVGEPYHKVKESVQSENEEEDEFE